MAILQRKPITVCKQYLPKTADHPVPLPTKKDTLQCEYVWIPSIWNWPLQHLDAHSLAREHACMSAGTFGEEEKQRVSVADSRKGGKRQYHCTEQALQIEKYCELSWLFNFTMLGALYKNANLKHFSYKWETSALKETWILLGKRSCLLLNYRGWICT